MFFCEFSSPSSVFPSLGPRRQEPLSLTSKSNVSQKYDVVGPICESSDCFGKAIELPELKRGDLIAVRTTGAYGQVMELSYNLRDKVKAYYNT